MAVPGNVGFVIPKLSLGRESFSPDVAYHLGTLPAHRMRFIEGPPTFAVEVQGESDDDRRDEAERVAKRMDSFEADTLVVWDVDPVANRVRNFHRDRPAEAVKFGRGDQADAEPALPGWRLAVDRIFA